MKHEGLPQLFPHHGLSCIVPCGCPQVTEHPPIWACKLAIGHDGNPVFYSGRDNIQTWLFPGMLELQRFAAAVQVPPAVDELGGRRGAMFRREYLWVAVQVVIKADAEISMSICESLLMFMGNTLPHRLKSCEARQHFRKKLAWKQPSCTGAIGLGLAIGLTCERVKVVYVIVACTPRKTCIGDVPYRLVCSVHCYQSIPTHNLLCSHLPRLCLATAETVQLLY